jgi:flavin-dependent dehydrogenase
MRLGEQGRGLPFESGVEGLCIVMGGRTYIYRSGRELGRTVVRRDLDAHLVEQARKAGCHTRQATKAESVEETASEVLVRTESGSLRAKYLVLAEGASGGSASRLLGEYPRGSVINGAALFCRDRLSPGLATFLLPGGRPGIPELTEAGAGICAAFPMREGTVLSTISRQGSGRVLDALRSVAGRLSLEPCGEGCAHPIPTAMRPRLATRRCLAVGDCAGLASPFSGEGLTPALESAGLAAEAVISSVREGRPCLAHYDRALRSRAGRDQLLARLTGEAVRLAVKGGWAASILAGLERDPHFIQAAAAVAAEEDGARRFLMRTLPRLPVTLAKGAR